MGHDFRELKGLRCIAAATAGRLAPGRGGPAGGDPRADPAAGGGWAAAIGFIRG